MNEKDVEQQLLEYLRVQLPEINFVGSDFENVGENPYYFQIYKYPDINEYEASVIRYNSEPSNKKETEVMNSIYNEIINDKHLIVSHLSRPAYRNFIGKYNERTGFYEYEESTIIQFYVNFKLREEQL